MIGRQNYLPTDKWTKIEGDEVEEAVYEEIAGSVLLPEQLIQPKYRTEYHDFLGYVLIDAVEILIGRKVAKPDDWDDDYNWLMGLDTGPLSFTWYCKILDVNQIALRSAVTKRLKRTEKKSDEVTLRPKFKSARKGGRPRKSGTPRELAQRAEWRRRKDAVHSAK